MITEIHLLVFVLVIFWLVVIYNIARSGSEKMRHHEKDDGDHWPLHHA